MNRDESRPGLLPSGRAPRWGGTAAGSCLRKETRAQYGAALPYLGEEGQRAEKPTVHAFSPVWMHLRTVSPSMDPLHQSCKGVEAVLL